MDDGKMRYCSYCDVYVGMVGDEMIVVTGDAFRSCLDYYTRIQDPDVADVYEPLGWRDVAGVGNHSAWFEPDESRESYGWYRSRGLEELHDHSLWLESMSREMEVSIDENALSLLEQQSPFFMAYVKQFPDLEVQVIADATAAHTAFALMQFGADLPFEQAVAGRDGAFRLCGVADSAGFADVASFFYGCYEVLCGHIVLYQG